MIFTTHILTVIRNYNEIDLYFDDMNDGIIYIIMPHLYEKDSFVLHIKRNWLIVNSIRRKYKDFNVNDINGLFELLKQRPLEVIERLLGYRVWVTKIIIRDLTKKNRKE